MCGRIKVTSKNDRSIKHTIIEIERIGIMRREASLEQWRELYEVAIKIKEFKPWQYFWDMDLITIILPEYREPFYCSVMGRNGECFAIGTYYGFNAINGFLKISESPDIPTGQLIRYQKNMMCYFGNRDELNKKELQVIKDLGLKFRGKNQWIYFHSFEPGYAPYILDQQEVTQLTLVFKQLYMALKHFIEGEVQVDFEERNTLFRMFDAEEGLWLTFEAPLMFPRAQYPRPVIEDEILMAKLKKQKIIQKELEIDIVFLKAVINDKHFSKPLQPKMLTLAEAKSDMILSQDILSPKDDEVQKVLGIIVSYILNIGRPKTIYVRDEYMESLLADLCERFEINLKIKGKLKGIDTFVKSLEARFFQSPLLQF
jgi:hypothetical protein